MTNIKYAVAHKGPSHADDFLALAFALALGILSFATKIFRRDPTPEELEDPEVLVLDVGNKHQPELNNFDHHQRSKDDIPECAMSLFLQNKAPDIYATLKEHTKWFNTTVNLDVNGPFDLAAKAGCHADLVFGLAGAVHSPVVKLLEDFQEETPVSESVMAILGTVGESHLEYAKDIIRVRASIKEHARVIDVGGVAVVLYDVEEASSALVPILNDFCEKFTEKDKDRTVVALAILQDDRGDGYALLRLNDDPRVNFAQLIIDMKAEKFVDGVIFAHPGGFIAKTTERDLDSALELVRMSLL
jgi:hypothetical protein